MARRRKKRRYSRKMTLPMATIVPIAAVGIRAGKKLMEGDWSGVSGDFTGFKPGQPFTPQWMIPTYGPIVAGAIVSYAASRLGINRRLGQAKIPLIRI